jgi:septum formation protein
MTLVLASGSPRRAELLTTAGFDFEMIPADVDETRLPGEPPREYAMRVAGAKCDKIRLARHGNSDIILAADTVVVADDRLMGKPADDDDARSMLQALSGRVHEVHTAVVAASGARRLERYVTTRVCVQPLTDREIDWYIATGEPRGKAGAYGIQGRAARFIDWIDGSWSNVVGLPIAVVHRLLEELGNS